MSPVLPKDTTHARFPFDYIVVTSPDEESAESAKQPLSHILLMHLQQIYPQQEIRVLSTCDPYGARCGSGGGTLAALEEVPHGQSVLILHAGGDSSRCPTQMILGKAWTNLPSQNFRNPIIWLVDQLKRLFLSCEFPSGTVVVAATDCIISLFQTASEDAGFEVSDWNSTESAVLGIAVPASVQVAKNHGVYLLPTVEAGGSGNVCVESPLEVWQKPSIESLIAHPNGTFCSPLQSHSERQAWIDTGVVIFLPTAVEVLRNLSNGILSMCTRSGLAKAHQTSPSKESLVDFAKAQATKIDLYTDILHNLTWPSRKPSDSSNSEALLQARLAQLSLEILTVRSGSFLHLGTTQELTTFLVQTSYHDSGEEDKVALSLSLEPRFRCVSSPYPVSKNVALRSIFPSTSTLGSQSVVEYCNLSQFRDVEIGDNSLISGWRTFDPQHCHGSLSIPHNLSVQLLSLKRSECVAYVVLGIEDGIKTAVTTASSTTMYGIPVKEYLRLTEIDIADLGWFSETRDCLWTAKIHPILNMNTSFESVFGWIRKLRNGDSVSSDPSWNRWKESRRVSLKDLHGLADAKKEWAFRHTHDNDVLSSLQKYSISVLRKSLTDQGRNEPVDLLWLLEIGDQDDFSKESTSVFYQLEDIILAEFEKGRHEICGRVCTIMSDLLATLNEKRAPVCDEQEEYNNQRESILQSIATLRATSMRGSYQDQRSRILQEIIQTQRENYTVNGLRYFGCYAFLVEQLSFCMAEFVVASGYLPMLEALNTTSCNHLYNNWILSSSPARIDLAGGWTDTPPLCYENGGSVTGVAVLVDGVKPLSCRCRLSQGRGGIFLKTEGRHVADGSLQSSTTVELDSMSSLKDFRDPKGKCVLLKAALLCVGVVSETDVRSNTNLQAALNQFCGSRDNSDVRLEIISTSLLPQGSGLGTSSILGGCVIAALLQCLGRGKPDSTFLLHAVLMLEQLMSCGGGWQDQANGLLPGIKTVRCDPSKVPIQLSVESIHPPPGAATLDDRLLLAFTGKTRLAKNILQNVLRRWAKRSHHIVQTVERLVQASEAAHSAVSKGDWKSLGNIVNTYADCKLEMAGADSGARPQVVHQLVSELTAKNAIEGAALCGAGGGGYLALILKESVDPQTIQELVDSELVLKYPALADFTWHPCQICSQGLVTTILKEENLERDAFDLNWHRSTYT